MSATDVRIARVTAAEVRPLRSEVLRPGTPPEKLVYDGDDAADALHVGARSADGVIQGIASLCRESAPGRSETAWRLRGMATRPERRGTGLGRRLLQACFRHVRSEGGALLWCNARVGAVGFYERLGLKREGEVFDVPDVGPHYVMSRWLAHLRPALRDEAASLSALAWRSKAHWGYPPDFMQRCAAELQVDPADIERGGRHHVTAEVRGEIVGFHVLVPELSGVVLLEGLWVEPAWIGRGIGRELFEHARGVATKLGASQLRVVSDPNAAGFYLRMGTAPAGEVASGSISGRLLPRFALDLA
ncbi:MAG: GNAT family N-acetyltransferase [Steroidobacteraceae bacterium]